MAFNLSKVLRALLFSSNQPLTVKDIQAVLARFHERAAPPAPAVSGEDAAETPPDEAVASSEEAPEGPEAPGEEVGEEAVEAPPPPSALVSSADEAELYEGVPSLITGTQIREAMEEIAAELRAADDLFLLIDGATGYRLVTHPRYARWIRILRDEPPPVKLTQSALETLAIIAYRQPVTRTEIESIRGVSAEAGLHKLLERELVYVVGRADLPGRPLQYGTTDRFLEFVGVKSLMELPASDTLSPRQIDEWLKNAIHAKPPSDAEMGLPLEDDNETLAMADGAEPAEGDLPAEAAEAPESESSLSPTSDEASSPETQPSA